MKVLHICFILSGLLSLSIQGQAASKNNMPDFSALTVDPCNRLPVDQPDPYNGYGSWMVLPFTDDDGGEYSLDGCVQKNNSKIYYWTLWNLMRPNELGWFSLKTLTELDCSVPIKNRPLSMTAFSQPYASGRIVFENNSKGEWEYLSNNTPLKNWVATRYCSGAE